MLRRARDCQGLASPDCLRETLLAGLERTPSTAWRRQHVQHTEEAEYGTAAEVYTARTWAYGVSGTGILAFYSSHLTER